MPPRNVVEEFIDNVADDYTKAFGDILGRQAGDEEEAVRVLAAPALALAVALPTVLRQVDGLGRVADGVLEGLDAVRSLLKPESGAGSSGGRPHRG
ncbi:hypothetical protein [Streptomyces sp. A012304]|uniref:hypothetical protein n=1 Tax=Streptomyces sp. A012304 TaxID=375446 RepID=UPI002230BD80|nr:hypothetical protein [Streptomyces sp. A012304]GKQ37946.1 hypothetical protein ALMP_44810 [Streptomyces sp. A012304]